MKAEATDLARLPASGTLARLSGLSALRVSVSVIQTLFTDDRAPDEFIADSLVLRFALEGAARIFRRSHNG